VVPTDTAKARAIAASSGFSGLHLHRLGQELLDLEVAHIELANDALEDHQFQGVVPTFLALCDMLCVEVLVAMVQVLHQEPVVQDQELAVQYCHLQTDLVDVLDLQWVE